jgi:hypothetical protein
VTVVVDRQHDRASDVEPINHAVIGRRRRGTMLTVARRSTVRAPTIQADVSRERDPLCASAGVTWTMPSHACRPFAAAVGRRVLGVPVAAVPVSSKALVCSGRSA